MSYEWLRYISPLLGVGLGVFIAPYLERKKSLKESQHALDCFYAELSDYYEDFGGYVKTFHDGYMKSKKAKLNNINLEKDLLPIGFCPKIDFLTTDTLIEKSFLILTKEQRKAIKALKILTSELNTRSASLAKYEFAVIDDFINAKEEFRSATQISSVLYYLISRLYTEKERFVYSDDSGEKTSRKVMNSLRISFDDSIFKNAQNKKIDKD